MKRAARKGRVCYSSFSSFQLIAVQDFSPRPQRAKKTDDRTNNDEQHIGCSRRFCRMLHCQDLKYIRADDREIAASKSSDNTAYLHCTQR